MPAKDKKEHRRYQRYNIDGCVVQSREKHLLGLFSKFSKEYLVLNVSRDGMYFASRKAFGKGIQVSFNITAPSLEDEAVTLKGRVTRLKRLEDLATYGVGVRFIAMDRTNRDKLKVLLEGAAKSKEDISSYLNIKATKK